MTTILQSKINVQNNCVKLIYKTEVQNLPVYANNVDSFGYTI